MKHIDYQLRQFVEISRYKSLSDAAVSLDLTQSALSRQLRGLEETVGHPVFRRHGRGVELTEQGDALRRAAQTAYKLIDTTVDQLRAEKHEIAGDLRVAMVYGLTDLVIRAYLSNLFGQSTDIGFAVTKASIDEVLRLVRSGSVDIGFVSGRTDIAADLCVTELVTPTVTSRCESEVAEEMDLVAVIKSDNSGLSRFLVRHTRRRKTT
jgi:LysR family cyn operon transcriptional activator